MGAAILGSAGNILLFSLFVVLSLRSPPGWVAGGSRAVGVGGWVRGWVGGGVRGGCQSIELVKLRRFAVLKREFASILENSCPSKTFVLNKVFGGFEIGRSGGGLQKVRNVLHFGDGASKK